MKMIEKFFQRLVKYVLSFFIMLFSFTVGLLTPRGQYIHSLICDYFGFSFNKTRLPLISWKKISGDEKITLTDLEISAGNMRVDELALICGVIRKELPKGILEIGTMNGRTTLNMAINAPEDCQVYTLDLPAEELDAAKYEISKRYQKLVKKEQSGALFLEKDDAEFPEKKKITQLFGDSARFDFSPYENQIDLVFIDGSHDYEYVLNDTSVAMQLLRNGKGVILWHDYRNGLAVVPAIEEVRRKYPDLEIYHIEDTTLAYAKIGR